MTAPPTSIVIAAFNSEQFILRTLQSALHQTFGEFEIVIVDDGSTDATPEIIRGVRDPRIHLLVQDNRGPSAARNTAIGESRAPVIVLLDHDDLWSPERLSRLMEHLKDHPETGFVSSNMFVGDPDRPDKARTILDNPVCAGIELGSSEAWARHCGFSSSTAAIRRELFDRHGLFDDSLVYAQDWDLTLRFWLEGEKHSMIEEPLGWTVMRSGQLSENTWGMLSDRKRVLEKALSRAGLPAGFEQAARQELQRIRRQGAQSRLDEAMASAARDPRRARQGALWAVRRGVTGATQKLKALACVVSPRIASGLYRKLKDRPGS